MNLGDYQQDDDLVFAVQCVDTGGSAAASAPVPSYRIYRDEVAAAVATGNMAQLDGQTGFYAETVALAAATFADGRYSIRVSATVDGETPAVVLFFRVGDPTTAFQTWQQDKADHQDNSIMGDIATDVDELSFTGQEG